MDERGFESINVIPFIDIMLVLLTIVLTTSTFIATGAIGVDLPESSQTTAPTQNCLRIAIDRSGQIYLGEEEIDIGQLETRLKRHEKNDAILLRADCQIPLQGFVSVMDRLQQLGFDNISLQTETTL